MMVTEFLQCRVPFLSGLTDEQVQALSAQTEQKSFKGGQTILFKGTTVDGLGVVAEGAVAVWAVIKKGQAPAQVARLGPGEVFGETSIIEMSTAGATVRAAEEGALVFTIPQEAFRGVLAQNAELQARVTALIAARKKQD